MNETVVYASVKPNEERLKNWLGTFVDRQPFVKVKIRECRTRAQRRVSSPQPASPMILLRKRPNVAGFAF
ncbi:MAG: hypothetical protein U0904_08720 [Candidatus Nanopelagicales bacterium]|nr:hypothetical protein [Candidatus Nanopelagicales bacterium]